MTLTGTSDVHVNLYFHNSTEFVTFVLNVLNLISDGAISLEGLCQQQTVFFFANGAGHTTRVRANPQYFDLPLRGRGWTI